jgi:hypothetical protein
MNDIFQQRVRAAAAAAWWTVFVALAVVLLQWGAYLLVLSARPAWFQSLWGPDVDWAFIRSVWFWGIVVLKFVMWLLALVAIWLSLWAGQLRKHAGAL